MILDNNTRKIQVVLDGAVATSELEIVVSYVDMTATTSALVSNNALTNGATAVDVVPAPGAGVQRKVLEMSIYNSDTVARTVTVRYNDNGTIRRIHRRTLQPGRALMYSPPNQWSLDDLTGPQGLAGDGFTSRGPWVNGNSYAARDIVTYAGATYECYLAVSPSTTDPSVDTTHFRVWAAKGASGGADYVHTQGSASASWTINHNLGFRPDIVVYSAGGVVIEALITHLSVNTAQIDFDTATTGTARAE